MALEFNPSALDTFRHVDFGNDDAIANLDGGKGVKQNGKLGSAFLKLFRSGTTQSANNAIRTELLRSLGRAFGLGGVSEAGGKVAFSKDFMDKLEKILGPAFKRADFGIAADGTVSSGKPLTQRRISAIVRQATVASRGKYDTGTYREKLAVVNAAIDRLGPGNRNADTLKAYFDHVGKCIDFLEGGLERYFDENFEYSEYQARKNPNYDVPRFAFVKPGKEGVPTATRAPFVNYLLEESPIHGLFHFELYHNLPRELKSQADIDTNLNYVRSTVTLYVQSSIDLFLDALEAGKTDELADMISDHPAACMDDKASMPGEFRKKLDLFTDEAPDVGPVAFHDAATSLDKCIYEEIKVAKEQVKNPKGWQDLADAVKKALVGLERPIVTLNESKGMLEPLMENGKPVVRKVTAEDVDRIGPACTDILAIF